MDNKNFAQLVKSLKQAKQIIKGKMSPSRVTKFDKASSNACNSKTDWERLSTMPDEQIDLSDIPELDDCFFNNCTVRKPIK